MVRSNSMVGDGWMCCDDDVIECGRGAQASCGRGAQAKFYHCIVKGQESCFSGRHCSSKKESVV